MFNRKSFIGSLLACSALLFSDPAHAAIITYNIDVTVTSAPLAPGSFASNQWSIPSTPVTYSGTFKADDTVAGPISNLNLTIGGLDIATSHSGISMTYFDPGTLLLKAFFVDPSTIESGIIAGDILGYGTPPNYAVAIQGTGTGYVDPYYPSTQNWVGTYNITPVPEPSAMALLGVGLAGLAVGNRKKRTGLA